MTQGHVKLNDSKTKLAFGNADLDADMSTYKDGRFFLDGYLFYKITSVLRQKCGYVCVICVSVL